MGASVYGGKYSYGSHISYGGVEIENPTVFSVTDLIPVPNGAITSGTALTGNATAPNDGASATIINPAVLVGSSVDLNPESSAFITHVLYQPDAQSYGGSETVSVYGGITIPVEPIAFTVVAPNDSADASLSNPALAGNVIEPVPTVEASILAGGVIVGNSVEPYPQGDAVFSLEQFISFAVTDPKPYAQVLIGEFKEVAFIDTIDLKPTANATIAAGGLMVVNVNEPLPVVSASFDDFVVKAKEPKPVSNATFNSGRLITFNAKEKKPTASASILGEKTLVVHAVEKKPTATITISAGGVMTAAVTDKKPSVTSRMVKGAVITGNVIDIKPVIQAKIVQEGRFTVAAVEPLPITEITLVNSFTVNLETGEVSAWALNTEVFAPTEYTDWQFMALASIGGNTYGVRADGLYLLKGENDNGAVINSEFMSGETDNDEDRHKRVPLIHADVEGSVRMLVGVDGDEYSNVFDSRAKFGRGMRGNRLAFGVRSLNGSRFKVRSIEPVVEVLKKRVK